MVRERVLALPILHSPFSIPGFANKTPRRSGAFVREAYSNQAAATTLTVRRFFGPLIAKSTLPLTSANKV